MTDEQKLHKARALIADLRSTGRHVWIRPDGFIAFENEFGMSGDFCADLLAVHEEAVAALRAEAAVRAARGAT